jgi:hypothetical protein
MNDEFIDDQPPIGAITPEARESLRLAIADTPADHPDRAKHTPGPWVAKGIHAVMSDGFQFKQQTPIGEGSCMQTQQRNRERRESNARLIAASPDLLEALRDMISDRNQLSEATVSFAKAAIAKATGEDAP